MNEVSNFKDLGILDDEFEIVFEDEKDGGGIAHLEFKSDEAREIFRAACARAGLSEEEYLRCLVLHD